VAQGTIALDNALTFQALQKTQRELEAAYDLTLWGWAKAVELRDQETAGHTERVTALTLRLARALGVPEEDLEHIRRGAILHDVGKLAIPDRILLKPGPLTEEEWAVMKRHPVYAYEWLSGIPFPQEGPGHPLRPPRTLGRLRLPPGPERGGHSPFRPHLRRGGRLRCPDLRPPLPQGLA
jgi:putative nucleotidyltransferase with HDIG domain